MYKIKQVLNEDEIKDFLKLPSFFYEKNFITQDTAEELLLIRGEHVLSKYFEFYPFVAYKEDEIKGRYAITIYPNDENAYLGFFECVDDKKFSEYIFSEIFRFVKDKGMKKIIGPVNASFWISYRMKVDKFEDEPYFAEPYNMPYYSELWESSGFVVCDKYFSSLYQKLPANYQNMKFKKRYMKFIEEGFVICSPDKKELSKFMEEIYEMIIELYSSFPVFKPISKEDFCLHFAGFKYILDLSVVRLAYKDEKTAGFFIVVPDYGNELNGKKGFSLFLKILKKKFRSSRYIALYAGVKPEYLGLGLAMSNPILEKVIVRDADFIGAFIHEGKSTAGYLREKICDRKNYFLYEKEIGNFKNSNL